MGILPRQNRKSVRKVYEMRRSPGVREAVRRGAPDLMTDAAAGARRPPRARSPHLCEKCAKCGRALKRGGAFARLRRIGARRQSGRGGLRARARSRGRPSARRHARAEGRL